MQDVSYEPLMLCPSENPQASLDIFSQPHHHPFGSCIYRKAINKNKHLSSGVLPLTLLNLGCTRHSSSQLGSALICTRFQADASYWAISEGLAPAYL